MQTVEQLTCASQLPLYRGPRVLVEILQPDGDLHLRGKLGERSEGYAYVIAMAFARSSGVALSYVRRN